MNRNDAGAFVLRVILGLTFFIHGLSKFQGGLGNTAGFFESLGIPGFLAYVVAFIELIGGIMLILGIGTRIVSVLFAVIMLGAIFKVKLSAGFLGDGQMAGYELDLALLAMAIFLAIANSSSLSMGIKFSVQKKENKNGGNKYEVS
jgi:putative oxidoreductase